MFHRHLSCFSPVHVSPPNAFQNPSLHYRLFQSALTIFSGYPIASDSFKQGLYKYCTQRFINVLRTHALTYQSIYTVPVQCYYYSAFLMSNALYCGKIPLYRSTWKLLHNAPNADDTSIVDAEDYKQWLYDAAHVLVGVVTLNTVLWITASRRGGCRYVQLMAQKREVIDATPGPAIALAPAAAAAARAFQFGQKKFRFDSIRFGNLINLPLVHWYSNSKLGVIFIVCIA